MTVKLQWITPDAEKQIAYIARVSNPANQDNHNTAARLLAYCIRNKHWSPFEMASMCVEITTTRDIGRQILRHRSFSFQEFSQRYADPTTALGFVTREARLQDPKNRQNSIETNNEELENQWIGAQESVYNHSLKAYKWAVDHGIAKEQARAVLPEGLVASRMYMSGTIRSWLHFVSVRGPEKTGTQKENRIIALQIADILKAEVPSIYEAFMEVEPI